MFCYLDGFANICTKVSPMEVVTLVNNMFTSFDRLSERHDVYKVRKCIKEINMININVCLC